MRQESRVTRENHFRNGAHMKIRRFEDLDAWKAARELARLTYTMADSSAIDSDLFLLRQFSSAAVSVMANIVEGFRSGSDREFTRFLRIAGRSAAEVRSRLHVALDRGCIKKESFGETCRKCDDTQSLIGGPSLYLSRPRRPASASPSKSPLPPSSPPLTTHDS